MQVQQPELMIQFKLRKVLHCKKKCYSFDLPIKTEALKYIVRIKTIFFPFHLENHKNQIKQIKADIGLCFMKSNFKVFFFGSMK